MASLVSGSLLLTAAMAVVGLLVARHDFRKNPFYQQSLEVARSSPEVKEALGEPIREGWFTTGRTQDLRGSEFAQWTTSLKGPRGRGRLYGVENRIGSSWHCSKLLFSSESAKSVIDLTPPPTRDKLLSAESKKTVFLVPLGPVAEEYLNWAPAYYEAKFGLRVEILPAITLSPSAWNATRRQVIAESSIASMKRALPEKANDPLAVLIGVTESDMYIESYDWRYALNFRDEGQFAVIATARLQPFNLWEKQNRALSISRFQKMLTKNVYLLCFNVPLSADYTSAVSSGIMSPAEVDYMSDEIIGAENIWHPISAGDEPTVSMVLKQGHLAVWRPDQSALPPTDVDSEYFAANLKIGLFIQRKTDFYLEGDPPLPFVRVYRNEEGRSRGFGVGTNDNLDRYLVGEYEKYVGLTLEDGGIIHFNRYAAGDAAGTQVYRAEAIEGSPFSMGKMVLQGRDTKLETNGGWTYWFPYRASAGSDEKLVVLTGYYDKQGRRFEMERNPAGDLLSITTPAGKWLHFEYDEKHRFHAIQDSEGRAVSYEYDEGGRLVHFFDSEGHSEYYDYDEKNRMREVLDGSRRTLMIITYSPEGWVTSQELEDGRSFIYEYARNDKGELLQNRFTDPRGYVTLFTYGQGRYAQSLPSRSVEKADAPEPFLE